MIRELHTQLKEKKILARALAEQYLHSIETRDGALHAYLTVSRERALAQAEEVDAQIQAGKPIDLLAGIPLALKDNLCVAGERTTAGSKILDNYIAPYNAHVVERLTQSGAVLLGKTNLDEFAMGSSTENSAYGPTKHPLDQTRVPGGSSGGSAVAVASDMAVVALGSDTGGSIRQPAAFCGVVGLKPTYGRVSRSGLIAMASSLDQIGPFGRTAEDVAIVLSRIVGRDPLDATTIERPPILFEDRLEGSLEGVKIGVPEEYFSKDLPDAIRALAENALATFKHLGCVVVPLHLPHAAFALPVYYILMPSEVSSNLARLDGIRYGLSVDDQTFSVEASSTLLETYLDTRRIGFGAEVKRRIMLGTYTLSAGYYDAYYKQAQRVRALIRRDFEHAFAQADVIFSPTTPEVAFHFGDKTADPLKMYLSDIYTVTANLAGIPAISFPIGMLEHGGKALPVGGQLMGKWFDEETLLRLTHAFERGQ